MSNRLKNIPSLDGLRGISVLLVMFHHSSIKNFFRGGFIGVDIFFAISGFLITTILLKERDATGSINLKRFYIRRARRLLPALLLMVGLCLSIGAVFSDRPSDLFKDALWAVSYVANLACISGAWHTKYLMHTWSLAVEEQFYIVWPFMLIRGVNRFPSLLTLFFILTSASIVPEILRCCMIINGSGVQRIVYGGLDTRSDPILLGCAGAILFKIIGDGVVLTNLKHFFTIAAFSSLSCLLVMSEFCTYNNDFMIMYGYFAVAILSALLVFSLPVIRNECLLNIFLSNRVLVYIGKISYGLYIWHFPIYIQLSRYCEIGTAKFIIVGVSLSFMVSILSFKLLESRFLAKSSPTEPVGVNVPSF